MCTSTFWVSKSVFWVSGLSLGSQSTNRGLCACRRRACFFKNRSPECPSMYFVKLVICFWFQGPLVKCYQIWQIWLNDYASKTRTEILYKKTCSVAPNHFPKSDFVCNSRTSWTLVRMSTGINWGSPTNQWSELELIMFASTNQPVKLAQ